MSEGSGAATTPRVLICEKIAASGIEVLRRHADVDDGVGLSREEIMARVADYDALVVRSATKVDAEMIAASPRLSVVGRAGTGVDNVDVDAATRRGIVVCNAPESNAVSAAEHAIALLLAQARNVPQAHTSLTGGKWERSKFAGIEVTGKTLGLLGFGRIGQLVAERAKGLRMNVVAYDPYVADARFNDLGVERATTPEDLYAKADFVSLHMALTPETRNIVDADALSAMRPGARLVNAARGGLVDESALAEAVTSGHIGGAAVDVFPEEPCTDSPLFGVPGIIVTPHLGASTAEAQDRAGAAVAQQVAAALTGGVVTTAVNIPAVSAETLAVIGPFLPLARHLGQLLTVLTAGDVSPLEVIVEGDLAEQDPRLLASAALAGIMHGHVEEAVNVVNAGSLARERGIEWTETTSSAAPVYTNRLTLVGGSDRITISGTTVGTTERPRLVSAFDQEIEIELGPNVGIFLYRDVPGMIGRVGTILGAAGVNVASMAVSRTRAEGRALMAVAVDSPVPSGVADDIAAIEGFTSVWFATLE